LISQDIFYIIESSADRTDRLFKYEALAHVSG
jgi:hypothetical protein